MQDSKHPILLSIYYVLLLVLVLVTGMLLIMRISADDGLQAVETPFIQDSVVEGDMHVDTPQIAIQPTDNAYVVPIADDNVVEEAVVSIQEEDPVVKEKERGYIEYDVPFIAQAPFGNWDDPRQQEGCEETSLLMAMHWAWDKGLNRFTGLRSILKMSDWELENYGEFRDTSAQDSFDWLVRDYFAYEQAELFFDIDTEDILDALYAGSIVALPVNGRALQNPYFSPPGPQHHFIVIAGYDPKTDEFITNDPGTKRGEDFRYSRDIMEGALRDYPTGSYDDGSDKEYNNTAMITISR